MMNKNMTENLEKLQRSALKLVFGFDKGWEELLEPAGICTLEERQKNLFNKLCLELHGNPRFKDEWLEERIFEGPTLRSQKIIKEKQSRTSRLFHSPLYTVRRRLNNILVQ